LFYCFTAFNITLWVIPSSTFKTNRQFSEYSINYIYEEKLQNRHIVFLVSGFDSLTDQTLSTRIPSASFNGIQKACLLAVPNSVLFFPPIGMILFYSRRLFSPALRASKFLTTPSSEMIGSSPAGSSPCWKPER